jgi:hypothetical protein
MRSAKGFYLSLSNIVSLKGADLTVISLPAISSAREMFPPLLRKRVSIAIISTFAYTKRLF